MHLLVSCVAFVEREREIETERERKKEGGKKLAVDTDICGRYHKPYIFFYS